jgi:hypothetical protein
MPGLNTAGTPNTNDYNLGRGKVYFAELDSNNQPQGFRDLGNATEFNLNVESEKLEHFSSQAGLKTVDKEVVISQKVGLTLTLDEINFQNLALFLSGTSASRFNVGGTAITGNGNLTVVNQGEWYDLYSGATGQPASNAQDARIYDIGVVTIEPNGGGSAYVEGTDYTVDRDLGRIFVIEGGDMVAGDYDVDVATYSSSTASVHEVKALTQSAIDGALKFVAINPADDSKIVEYNFHQVRLAAEGDLSLIGDDWTVMQLTGTAESNSTADTDSPTLTIITNPRQT